MDPARGAFDGDRAPRLIALDVDPDRATILPQGGQQLRGMVRYSEGTERDVTALAMYESNDSAMADVSAAGLASVRDVAGRVSVMVRYQGQVAVFSATVLLGAPVESVHPAKNLADGHVFATLKALGIPPSPVMLIVVTGEFGRTPKIDCAASPGEGNASAPAGTQQTGRDHWPRTFSNLWAGDGIAPGYFNGATDKRDEDIKDRICGPGDLLATILPLLGDRLGDGFNGRPTPIVDHGKPIPK